MRNPLRRRSKPGRHTEPALAERCLKRIGELEARLVALETERIQQERRLVAAFGNIHRRLGQLDGGQRLALPASNPLAETLPTSRAAGDALAKRNPADGAQVMALNQAAAAGKLQRRQPGWVPDQLRDHPQHVEPARVDEDPETTQQIVRAELDTADDGERTQEQPAAAH